MPIDRKEFYKIVQKDHAQCEKAQQVEAEKAQQGSHLAGLRAIELNTYLSVFQGVRDYIGDFDSNICSQKDLAEMKIEVNKIRERFLKLLKDPEYTGRTGEIDAEWAEKAKQEAE